MLCQIETIFILIDDTKMRALSAWKATIISRTIANFSQDWKKN